jgi:DNA-binding MarR family transcriptional regulator
MINTKATGWTFAQVPIWLLCNHDISDGAKVLFAYLKYRQGTDAACWPSKETMARDLGISKDTVTRRIRELDDATYIKRHIRAGTTTLYELVADPLGEREKWEAQQQKRRQEREQRRQPPRKNAPPPSRKSAGDPSRKNAPHDDNHEPESENDTSASDEAGELTGDALLDSFGLGEWENTTTEEDGRSWQERVEEEPWLTMDASWIHSRNGVSQAALRRIYWLVLDGTGWSEPLKPEHKRWMKALNGIYHEANGDFGLVEFGVQHAMGRDPQYRPSGPEGIINAIRQVSGDWRKDDDKVVMRL